MSGTFRAAFEHGEVQWIRIDSEAGSPLRVILPWKNGTRCVNRSGGWVTDECVLQIDTLPGEQVRLLPLGQ